MTAQTNLSLMQATQSNPLHNKDMSRIEETAREFEAVFISEMIKPMFEGIEVNKIFGGGKGEEMFRGLMIQEYGKQIAKRDVTGIQTQVKNKLLQMQAERTAANEMANAPAPAKMAYQAAQGQAALGQAIKQ